MASQSGDKKKELAPRGERIKMALGRWTGVTQTSLERSLELGNGRLTRLMYVDTQSVQVDDWEKIARTLHVAFEWLVLGEGPVVTPTPRARAVEAARVWPVPLPIVNEALAKVPPTAQDDESATFSVIIAAHQEWVRQRSDEKLKREHQRDTRRMAKKKKAIEASTRASAHATGRTRKATA